MNESEAFLTQQPAQLRPQLHKFPPQLTPFIGRAEEVVEITNLLADPDCRLLTLVGVGGCSIICTIKKCFCYWITLSSCWPKAALHC